MNSKAQVVLIVVLTICVIGILAAGFYMLLNRDEIFKDSSDEGQVISTENKDDEEEPIDKELSSKSFSELTDEDRIEIEQKSSIRFDDYGAIDLRESDIINPPQGTKTEAEYTDGKYYINSDIESTVINIDYPAIYAEVTNPNYTGQVIKQTDNEICFIAPNNALIRAVSLTNKENGVAVYIANIPLDDIDRYVNYIQSFSLKGVDY